MSVDVSIAMVGHGHREYLGRALSSVFDSGTRRRFEVIFVDNDGNDGSAEYVAGAFPQVRLIRNRRPEGFSTNNNRAFGVSRGRYFFMLNPDTALQCGAVDEMVDFLDKNPRAGMCGPKLVFPDGELQLSCRRFPTVRSFLLRRTPLRLLYPPHRRDAKHLMVDFDHDSAGAVDWVLGAAVMIRREVYEAIQGMDERLPMYCEDIDLCHRVRRANWEVYYAPSAVVVHEHLAETDETFFSLRTLAHFRSMLRYVRTHGVSWR